MVSRLQPIVLTRFPFLVTKADDIFARYARRLSAAGELPLAPACPHLREGVDACIEDLGSTNGTFVNGKRLDEHAVPLADGDVVGLGGSVSSTP